ncbi:MAG: hypothetical protein ACKVHP_20890 [Verrucomicrobiales bacterium]
MASSFHFGKFTQALAKWVRRGHVQTDQHWRSKAIVPNKLQ